MTMALDVFQRLSNSIRARLGEDAVLRGATPCRVVLDENVEVVEESAVFNRLVASIQVSLAPKVGDHLAVRGKTFALDGRISDDGVDARFVLREI